MIKNIYGKTIRNIDKMRVEEKIEHLRASIPSDLYDVFTQEWDRFNTICVQKGKGKRKLEEFDYYFELFMKFPH